MSTTETLSRLAKTTMHDRAVGTLVGSALGDAVGLYTEFLSAERARREYPSGKFTLRPNPTPLARDFHRLKHIAGEWTDDTDHALLILLSYLHSSTLDPKDVAARLFTWVNQGLRALDTLPLGLGATVGEVVRTPGYVDDPAGTAYRFWVKKEHRPASNGSLMRTHPLGIMCVHHTLEETFEVAARFCAITHVDPRTVVACTLGTALVRGLIRGEVRTEQDVDAMIDAAIGNYTSTIVPLFRKEGLFSDAAPPLDVAEFNEYTHVTGLEELELDKGGIGYVLKALGSGVCLLRQAILRVNVANSHASAQSLRTHSPLRARTEAFEPLMTALVMCAGDADTNACFAGALLGAYLGYAALPAGWRGGLLRGDWLLGKAEALAQVLELTDGDTYVGAEDKDTAPDGGRGFLTPQDMERRFMELQARMAQETTEFMRKEEEASKRRSSKVDPGRLSSLFGWGS